MFIFLLQGGGGEGEKLFVAEWGRGGLKEREKIGASSSFV